MKITVRSIIKTILTVILIVGLLFLGIRWLEDYRSRQEYDSAEQIAIGTHTEAIEETEVENPQQSAFEVQPEETETQQNDAALSDPNVSYLLDMDLDALQEVNDDVIGWLYVPDTRISYPLVQGTDNSYYLKHTWMDKANFAGAIFMEYQNSPDLSDFNTIIYGHNMNNKTMFGALREYRYAGYWEEHPSIYVLVDGGVYRYDVFSMREASVKSITYAMQIETPEKKEEFIQFALNYSNFETGLVPTVKDKILTLSTCSGSGYETRWVVQGILNKEGSYKIPD